LGLSTGTEKKFNIFDIKFKKNTNIQTFNAVKNENEETPSADGAF
jgi:hypothetical protein